MPTSSEPIIDGSASSSSIVMSSFPSSDPRLARADTGYVRGFLSAVLLMMGRVHSRETSSRSQPKAVAIAGGSELLGVRGRFWELPTLRNEVSASRLCLRLLGIVEIADMKSPEELPSSILRNERLCSPVIKEEG